MNHALFTLFFPNPTLRNKTMKNRKWDAKIKANIVLQGLKSRPPNEICKEYNISRTQYYRWRKQFLANAHLTFELDIHRTAIISRQNIRLKKIIGELTSELKRASLARENIHLKKTIGNLAIELRKNRESRLPGPGE
jgi:transposase-like protein